MQRITGSGPGRVLGWMLALATAAVVVELAIYLLAVTLFPHLDTPSCAGADTFCSPGGTPGPTGGAVVVVVGNLLVVAALIGVVVLLRRVRRPAG